MSRRVFLGGALGASGGLLAGCAAPGPRKAPPGIPFGAQSGDVTKDGAIVWCKADRAARMIVEWSLGPAGGGATRVAGPLATDATDFTARLDLRGLPAGRRIHYRVHFEDPDDRRVSGDPVTGSFQTPPEERRDVLVAWSGDTAGQGWGIDPARGGMATYDAIRRLCPDFFIHCGDVIYADGPMKPEIDLADGSVWRNLLTPAKAAVAETLDDFRGNFTYNLLDEHVRRCHAEVSQIVLWDDHEVYNNWYPGMILDDPRYVEQRAGVLAARARQAMLEHVPLRPASEDPARVYRVIPWGPSLSVFALDCRTYRAKNGENREPTAGPETAFLGRVQLDWLKQSLAASTATWKVIASDMPVGLLVPGGKQGGPPAQETWTNGPGPPLGREHELAELLAFLKQRGVRNVVVVTADVHYTAAHHYDPSRAEFTDFDPFWEFVSGPLHAGTFGPNTLDPTFGPEVRFQRAPAPGRVNLPPSEGMQFFGTMRIHGATEVMTVKLHDRAGAELYAVDLEPAR